MGFQTSEISGIRWLPCINKSKEEIPPYALMMLHDYANPQTHGYGAYEQDGQAVWHVNKCDEAMEDDQNPACLFINSGEPIPPGKPGRCTRDWPCQVAHDGTNDKLGPGLACGPKRDSWFIWSTGSAFACMGHNAADPIKPKHTVWVSNERIASNSIWGSFALSGTPDEGELITMGGPYIGGAAAAAYSNLPGITDFGISLDAGVVTVGRFAMRALFVLTAQIYGDNSVPAGTSLALRVTHKRGSGAVGTYIASRDQDIEKACSGGTTSVATLFITKEMVTIAGQFADLRKGDVIEVRNVTGYPVTVVGNLEISGFPNSAFRVGSKNND